jgi:hypothetical protein
MEILVTLTSFHNVNLLEAGMYRVRLDFANLSPSVASLVSWSRIAPPAHSVRNRALTIPGLNELCARYFLEKER